MRGEAHAGGMAKRPEAEGHGAGRVGGKGGGSFFVEAGSGAPARRGKSQKLTPRGCVEVAGGLDNPHRLKRRGFVVADWATCRRGPARCPTRASWMARSPRAPSPRRRRRPLLARPGGASGPEGRAEVGGRPGPRAGRQQRATWRRPPRQARAETRRSLGRHRRGRRRRKRRRRQPAESSLSPQGAPRSSRAGAAVLVAAAPAVVAGAEDGPRQRPGARGASSPSRRAAASRTASASAWKRSRFQPQSPPHPSSPVLPLSTPCSPFFALTAP